MSFIHWILLYQMIEAGLNALHRHYIIKFLPICHPLLGKFGYIYSEITVSERLTGEKDLDVQNSQSTYPYRAASYAKEASRKGFSAL